MVSGASGLIKASFALAGFLIDVLYVLLLFLVAELSFLGCKWNSFSFPYAKVPGDRCSPRLCSGLGT